MSYIGKEPQYTDFPSKFFNGDGTAMTVTLDYAPPNLASLLVFIDGVRQDTSAYTISGYNLTFTGVVPSGTNNVQVVHMGMARDVNVPALDSVATASIQDDAVTSAKLANSLNITSGNSLTIDSGATITNNGTASGFGGNNTPIFASILSGGQSISASTWTKIQLNSTQTDTDTAWDAVNYRWTVPSGEGGKYLISGAVRYYNGSGGLNARYAAIYKNGTIERLSLSQPSVGSYRDCPTVVTILELSASDYIELYGYFTSGSTTSIEDSGTYLNINKLVE